MKLTKKQEEACISAIIQSGELDLGFCKLVKKQIKGGRGKSHGTEFTIKKFYKLGVIMSKKLKEKLSPTVKR